MFTWPHELMYSAIVALFLAIVVPWMFPSKFRLPVGAVLAVLSIAIWYAYEVRLYEVAPRGRGALIRVELFLMLPLLLIGIINLFVLMYVSVRSFLKGRR